jgi:hypothetical protein
MERGRQIRAGIADYFVHAVKRGRRWSAMVELRTVNGITRHESLSCFASSDEAIAAGSSWARRMLERASR